MSPSTINGNKAVTAKFGRISHTLTMQTSGKGEIWVEPAAPYLHNQRIELRAVPRVGWHFSTWSGALTGQDNPAQLVMDEDKSVTAIFTADPTDDTGYQQYLPFVTR